MGTTIEKFRGYVESWAKTFDDHTPDGVKKLVKAIQDDLARVGDTGTVKTIQQIAHENGLNSETIVKTDEYLKAKGIDLKAIGGSIQTMGGKVIEGGLVVAEASGNAVSGAVDDIGSGKFMENIMGWMKKNMGLLIGGGAVMALGGLFELPTMLMGLLAVAAAVIGTMAFDKGDSAFAQLTNTNQPAPVKPGDSAEPAQQPIVAQSNGLVQLSKPGKKENGETAPILNMGRGADGQTQWVFADDKARLDKDVTINIGGTDEHPDQQIKGRYQRGDDGLIRFAVESTATALPDDRTQMGEHVAVKDGRIPLTLDADGNINTKAGELVEPFKASKVAADAYSVRTPIQVTKGANLDATAVLGTNDAGYKVELVGKIDRENGKEVFEVTHAQLRDKDGKLVIKDGAPVTESLLVNNEQGQPAPRKFELENGAITSLRAGEALALTENSAAAILGNASGRSASAADGFVSKPTAEPQRLTKLDRSASAPNHVSIVLSENNVFSHDKKQYIVSKMSGQYDEKTKTANFNQAVITELGGKTFSVDMNLKQPVQKVNDNLLIAAPTTGLSDYIANQMPNILSKALEKNEPSVVSINAEKAKLEELAAAFRETGAKDMLVTQTNATLPRKTSTANLNVS